MELIVVFSTGRCGTALIAQYFGGLLKSKSEWKVRRNVAISHEPFDSLVEYWAAISDIKRGEKAEVGNIITEELRKVAGCNRFLISDNKLGRWFMDDLQLSGLIIKAIYLTRDENEVINSLKRVSPEIGTGWCYESSDIYSLTDRTLDPYWYHVKETSAQWFENRKKLRAGQYIEVSLERFLKDREQRKKLEAFVGLSGCEDLLKRKTNRSLPFLGLVGYRSVKEKVEQILSDLIRKRWHLKNRHE